jgi:multiple sugar transport system permease protein
MKQSTVGWLFLAPAVFVLMVVGLLPFLYILYVGFFDWNSNALDPNLRWAGLQNYRTLVFDTMFLNSIGRTLAFAFIVVLSELLIGYVLARALMADRLPGRQFFRTIHTLPIVVAPIAVGATWRLLCVPGLGLIPYYLKLWFGIDYNISTNAGQAFLTAIVMDLWHWTPFVTLSLMAGLTALPKEQLEQAQIDGGNRLQIFWYVIVPMLKPVILTTTFIRLMDALRSVDEIWMLTKGGPAEATRFTLYGTIVLSWLLFAAMGARRQGAE